MTLGRTFSDWRLLSGEPAESGALGAANLESEQVVAMRAVRDRPLVLARHTTIPDGGTPRLRLQLANVPRDPCVVEVRFNGERLFREDVISRRTDQQPSRSLEIDLSRARGKTGWLVIEATPAENRSATNIFWEQIDIVY
jgi:hypothetical protein